MCIENIEHVSVNKMKRYNKTNTNTRIITYISVLFYIADFNQVLRSQQGAARRPGVAGQSPQVSQTASGVPRRGSTRRANLFGRRRPVRQEGLTRTRAATLIEKTAANVQNR